MRLYHPVVSWLRSRMESVTAEGWPDFVIGGGDPYLKRWYIIPRNKLFNIYLHEMWRSDDDRALHDHPWIWASLILRSHYIEVHVRQGGTIERKKFGAGSFRIHFPWFAHRLEMPPSGFSRPMSLVFTGPVVRSWGFHCPQRWVDHTDFTDKATGGATVGKGCGE